MKARLKSSLSRLRTKDIALVLLAMLVFGLSSTALIVNPEQLTSFLYPPVKAHAILTRHLGAPAKIYDPENKVTITATSSDKPLPDHFIIQTAKESRTEINLSAGITLELNSETNTEIQTNTDTPLINLISGEALLRFKGTGTIQLKFDQWQKINTEHSALIKLTKYSNNLQIYSVDGTSWAGFMKLPNNNWIEIEDDNVKTVSSDIEIHSPLNGQTIYSNGTAKTVFSWSSKVKQKLLLTVSQEPLFEKPSFVLPIASQKNQVELKLPTGAFFWKLESLDSKNTKNTVSSYAFEIKDNHPPTTVYPPHLSVIEIAESKDLKSQRTTASKSSADPHPVNFIVSNYYQSHEIKIFTDNKTAIETNSNEPIVSRIFHGRRIDGVLLYPGNYSWQVRGYSEKTSESDDEFAWSPLQKFRIQDYNEKIPPPRLLSRQLSEHNVHGRAAESKISVVFDKVFGAKFYQLEVRVNTDEPVLLDQVESPTLVLDNRFSGVHMIRARAVHSPKNTSEWSKTVVKILHGRSDTIENDRE